MSFELAKNFKTKVLTRQKVKKVKNVEKVEKVEKIMK
jgi:hypothetical protein